MKVEKQLKKGNPFAIMQSYEYFKLDKSLGQRNYELLKLNDSGSLYCKKLNREEVNEFKSLIDQFELVIQNEHGRVWEFKGFRSFYELNKKKAI